MNSGSGCRWVRAISLVFLAAFAMIACVILLVSCAPASSFTQESSAQKVRLAGDTALPSLDGEYAYLLVQVVSKHESTDSVEVKIIPWEPAQPFPIGSLSPNAVGSVLCTNLAFFPGGIHDGSTVVVSCLTEDAREFPVTAYSIERVDKFHEMFVRWSSV